MRFLANAKKTLGLASTADEIAILEKKLIDAVNAQNLASKLKDKDIPELQRKISAMNNEYAEKKNTKSVNETKIAELKKQISEKETEMKKQIAELKKQITGIETEMKNQITGIEKEIAQSKTTIADVDNFFKEYTKLEEEKKNMEASLKKNTENSTPKILLDLENDIKTKKGQKIQEDIDLADKKQKDSTARKEQFDKLKNTVGFSKAAPAAADGRRRRKSGSKNKSVKRRKSGSKRSDGRRRKSLHNKKSPKKKSKRSDGSRKRKSPSKKRSTKRRRRRSIRKSLY